MILDVVSILNIPTVINQSQIQKKETYQIHEEVLVPLVQDGMVVSSLDEFRQEEVVTLLSERNKHAFV